MLAESPIDFSQYGQPSFTKRFIPPEAPRWVIDVGAHDGIDGSVPAEVFAQLPKDGASEHDHYLHGHPKSGG